MDTTAEKNTGIENKVRPIGEKFGVFIDKETGDTFKFHVPSIADKSLLEQSAMNALYRTISYHALNATKNVLFAESNWALIARLTTLIDEAPEWFGVKVNGEFKVNMEVFDNLEREEELLRLDLSLREFIKSFRRPGK